ncbi:MAG: 3'-5' exonuclease [Candidatus Wallbacteria bacterium]
MDAKISIGIDFLYAFSKISHNEQKRVREFIEKFQENPLSKAINYEQIHDFKDKNLRTARIDSSYRAIIFHPEQGNNFILVWVDHHDEAMEWARNKKFDVNKFTGAIQVFDYKFIDNFKTEEEKKWEFTTKSLFHKFQDDDLLLLGVPEPLLETVKKIDTEAKLDKLSPYLPQEVSDALYYLACGNSLEETINEITSKVKDVKVNVNDFDKALEHEDSKRRFKVIENATELNEILNSQLEKWRIFLHPAQKKLVEMNANGSVRVLGGAGTGKTVVAMHRAKYLAETIFPEKDARILFTTYSKNLAADIKENLSKLCGSEIFSKIEVTNIDQWVNAFLKKHGYICNIINDKTEGKECWNRALALKPSEFKFSDKFYFDEWKNIILPNGINNIGDYVRVSRVGCGRSITCLIRQKIWPVFEEYRRLITLRGKKEYMDLIREAKNFLEKNPCILPYKAVVVDEGQDMDSEVYKLIRKLVPENANDIFIVGDCFQKIYAKKVVLSQCGINIRSKRTKKLKLNYRTTEEIRKWAVQLFDAKEIDDLNGEIDNQNGYRSLLHGPEPEIKQLDNENKEFEFLQNYIKNLIKNGISPATICMVARTNDIVNRYKLEFKKNGIESFLISRDGIDRSNMAGVRFATMHRIKGLEFDYIIVASANKDIIPLKKAVSDYDNETDHEEADLRERALLYVAVTRAKKEVLITYYGEKSEYL